MSALCSNDPICAQHAPGQSVEERWLHGVACHGCALVAETSCETRNDYLDCALVAPVLGVSDAAFFQAIARSMRFSICRIISASASRAPSNRGFSPDRLRPAR